MDHGCNCSKLLTVIPCPCRHTHTSYHGKSRSLTYKLGIPAACWHVTFACRASPAARRLYLWRDDRDGESTSWPLSSDTWTRFVAGSSARGVRNNASSTYFPRSTLSYVLRGTWSVTPLGLGHTTAKMLRQRQNHELFHGN